MFNIPAITWTLTAAAPMFAVMAGHAATGRAPADGTVSQTSI
ncbi:hypothetical protein [Arthrobacter methylotrophus]